MRIKLLLQILGSFPHSFSVSGHEIQSQSPIGISIIKFTESNGLTPFCPHTVVNNHIDYSVRKEKEISDLSA